jgi:hypothetical protein
MEEHARRLSAPRGSSKDRSAARDLLSRAGDLRELSFVLIWLMGRPDLELSKPNIQGPTDPRKPVVLAATPDNSEPDGEAITAFATPLAHLEARLLSCLDQLMMCSTSRDGNRNEGTQGEHHLPAPEPIPLPISERIPSDDPTLVDFPEPRPGAASQTQNKHTVREAS